MTAPLERPAGRPTSSARPAGARRSGQGSRPTTTDPLIIRQVLAACDTRPQRRVAAEFGVAISTVATWRARRDAAASAGAAWPSDVDVAEWAARQPELREQRIARKRWLLRRSVSGGPMLIDAVGTRRRLQALAAIGWRYRDLADELGVVTSRVGHMAVAAYPLIHRDTAAAVRALYDRLSMTPGPSGRNRALALGRGWVPPLAWDDEAIDDPAARPTRGGTARGAAVDEVAVARAMRGDRIDLAPAERAEAVRRLTAGERLSAAEIAARLDISKRSVVRRRSTPLASRRSA